MSGNNQPDKNQEAYSLLFHCCGCKSPEAAAKCVYGCGEDTSIKYSIKMRAVFRDHSGTLAIIGGRELSVRQLQLSVLNFLNKRKSSEGRFDQRTPENQGGGPVARCALA